MGGRHEADVPARANLDIVPWRVRHYLYPIITATVVLLGAYGVVAETDVPLWIALGAALVGQSTATAYTPSERP